MKLRQRVVLTCFGFTALSVLYLLVETVYNLSPDRLPDFLKNSLSNVRREYDGSHISAIRKRLNKSNYTSDDFSPEGGGEKTPGEGANLHSMDDRPPRGGGIGGLVSPLIMKINETDSEVDTLLTKLQSFNNHKYNFDRLRTVPYKEYLITLRKRIRKKGSFLEAYRTFIG